MEQNDSHGSGYGTYFHTVRELSMVKGGTSLTPFVYFLQDWSFKILTQDKNENPAVNLTDNGLRGIHLYRSD